MKKVINICAYKAIDSYAKAIQLHETHTKIMGRLGLSHVIALNTSWILDENVYFITAEMADTGEIIAGARIEIKSQKNHLPIETALTSIGKNLNDHFIEKGTAEFSGLWTSKKFESLGLSSTHLANAIVSLSYMLKLNCLIGIYGENTANISKTWGFECNHSFGDNFIYPTAGLTTCIMTIENLQDLAKRDFDEKDNIFNLIQNPISQRIISRINKEVEINYSLGISLTNNVEKFGKVA